MVLDLTGLTKTLVLEIKIKEFHVLVLDDDFIEFGLTLVLGGLFSAITSTRNLHSYLITQFSVLGWGKNLAISFERVTVCTLGPSCSKPD